MSTAPHAIFQQCHPQLASTLYKHEQQRPKPRALKTGIPALDRAITLPAGAVIGIAGTDAKHAHASTLLYGIATTCLLTTTARVFLIESPPPSQSALLRIYKGLAAAVSETAALDALTARISVLRPLDLLGVLQALAEVATALTDDGDADAADAGGLVVLRGLGPCVLASRTGVTRTAALLEGVVRAVRRLKGKVTVLVEGGVGVSEGVGGEQLQQHGSVAVVGVGVGVRLRSAFSSARGRRMRFVLEGQGQGDSRGDGDSGADITGGGGSGRHMRERMPLVRMVEDLLDVLIVVHDGFGVTSTKDIQKQTETSMMEKCIVEVIKDESGGGLGHWAAWDVKREDG